ncbi:MAG: hypothetical protein ABWZ80_04145 [Beijerinckiaceae bacterium]
MKRALVSALALGTLLIVSTASRAEDENVLPASDQFEMRLDALKAEVPTASIEMRAERRSVAPVTRRARVETPAPVAAPAPVTTVALVQRPPERKVAQIWLWMGF